MSELEMTGLELLEAVGSKLTDKQVVALVLAVAEVPDHELSCGDPGHDYTDHIVEYKGRAILDIELPEGPREARSPAPVGPKWTPSNGRTSTSTSNGGIRRR